MIGRTIEPCFLIEIIDHVGGSDMSFVSLLGYIWYILLYIRAKKKYTILGYYVIVAQFGLFHHVSEMHSRTAHRWYS
jgi:hypothetical protein